MTKVEAVTQSDEVVKSQLILTTVSIPDSLHKIVLPVGVLDPGRHIIDLQSYCDQQGFQSDIEFRNTIRSIRGTIGILTLDQLTLFYYVILLNLWFYYITQELYWDIDDPLLIPPGVSFNFRRHGIWQVFWPGEGKVGRH